jgi:hypothetical protein
MGLWVRYESKAFDDYFHVTRGRYGVKQPEVNPVVFFSFRKDIVSEVGPGLDYSIVGGKVLQSVQAFKKHTSRYPGESVCRMRTGQNRIETKHVARVIERLNDVLTVLVFFNSPTRKFDIDLAMRKFRGSVIPGEEPQDHVFIQKIDPGFNLKNIGSVT